MDAFTCKIMQIEKAPKRIKLIGDKARPEPAQHVIEFPGGAVEVSRCSDGTYWCHIHVNRGEVIEDAKGLRSAHGKIVGSRIATEDKGLTDETLDPCTTQVAVRIQPMTEDDFPI